MLARLANPLWMTSRFSWTRSSPAALAEAERKLLQQFAPSVTAHRVPINDQHTINVLLCNAPSLAALKRSPRPPIVLVHGFGAAAAMWYANIEAIAAQVERPVLSIDLLGFGASSRPRLAADADPASAENFFVDSMHDLVRTLELGKLVLVGHSLGGFLSAAFAIKHRELVDKLVLASPVGVPRKPEGYEASQRRLFRVIFALWERGLTPQQLVRFAGPRGERLVRAAVQRRFWTLTPAEHDVLADYIYQISAAPKSAEVSMNTILSPGAFARLPLADRIDRLDHQLETLWLYGESDWMDPTKPIEWLTDVRRQHRWQMRFVPDAGHQLFMENPDAFNQTVSAFIRGELQPQQIVRRRVRRATRTNDF